MNNKPSGTFPLRSPIGVLSGILLSLVIVFGAVRMANHKANELQRWYLGAYLETSVAFSQRPHDYLMRVAGPVQNPTPVITATLPIFRTYLRTQKMQFVPARLHTFIERYIYGSEFFDWLQQLAIGTGALVLLCLVLGRFCDVRRQREARSGTHLRGTRMVSPFRFNWIALKRHWWPRVAFVGGRLAFKGFQDAEKGVAFRVNGLKQKVYIPKELESYHLNIIGSTGTGKSTLLRELVYQILARGDVIVGYDPKGELYQEFYKPGDIVLDPTSDLVPYFALEDEARDIAEATPWGKAFWPDEPNAQPFFKKHPRSMFSLLLAKHSAYNNPEDMATCANMAYWLSHREQLVQRLRGTQHEISLNRGGSREGAIVSDQSQGLFSTLGEAVTPLGMMPATSEGRIRFSVREWSKTRHCNIFMTSTPNTVDALLPLQSAIMDMLILHNQQPIDPAKKLPHVWFILDELSSLQRLPQLEGAMTKQRASGNPMVLGFHDQAALVERYGINGAKTVMSQAYTSILLRVGHPDEGKNSEQMLGHEEVERIQENRPVHVSAKHKSRSWSNQVVERAQVMAAEFNGIPRFQGYIIQEGKAVHLKIQKLAKKIVAQRVERIIPQSFLQDDPPEQDEIVESVAEVSEAEHAAAMAAAAEAAEKLPLAEELQAIIVANMEQIREKTIAAGLTEEDFEGPPITRFICGFCRGLTAFPGKLDTPDEDCCGRCGEKLFQFNGEYLRNTVMKPHKKKREKSNPLTRKKKGPPAGQLSMPIEPT